MMPHVAERLKQGVELLIQFDSAKAWQEAIATIEKKATTTPRCIGQNCPRKNQCATHKNPSRWIDQYRVTGCKKFIKRSSK